MIRLGVISDTHGLLRPEVEAVLKECQGILHAGDIGTDEVLCRLREIAPVFAVSGNADGGLSESLPHSFDETFEGVRIHAVHQKKLVSPLIRNADILLTGHTHRYREVWEKGVLFLNPGSCGPKRYGGSVTMAVLSIHNGTYLVEKRVFLEDAALQVKKDLTKDMVRFVMKETSKKRSVEEISNKSGLPKEMVETIVRLYLTHPGVNAEGILRKMGL